MVLCVERTISELEHPILTRRVKIRHDAIENTIYIEDTDVETELYTDYVPMAWTASI